MHPYQTLSSSILNDAGLNCHAVWDVATLAPAVKEALLAHCPQAASYRQLILIGHGGTRFWRALQASGCDLVRTENAHPVDAFTIATVQEFLRTESAPAAYQIVYPGDSTISLQELGKLAGWHHASPFMVGINASFGSWFAYRALVLADTALPVLEPIYTESPCASCSARPCVNACPAHALDDGRFDLKKCIDYRQQADSLCNNTCVARTSCPVAGEHRYTEAQMHYHYGRSLQAIHAFHTATQTKESLPAASAVRDPA